MSLRDRTMMLPMNGLMVMAAFRYSLGRRTYIVSDCTSWLITIWKHLDEGTRKIIERDLEEAFARAAQDLKALKPGETFYSPLGDECDRAAWCKVRRLYRAPRCVLCNHQFPAWLSKPKRGERAGTVMTDGEIICETCERNDCVGGCGTDLTGKSYYRATDWPEPYRKRCETCHNRRLRSQHQGAPA